MRNNGFRKIDVDLPMQPLSNERLGFAFGIGLVFCLLLLTLHFYKEGKKSLNHKKQPTEQSIKSDR